MERLWDLAWLWYARGAEAVLTLEGILGWGGQEIWAMKGGKALYLFPGWNWGGRIAVQMLEVGQRKGKVHRWLPFCQEMPDLAARLGCEHSCADFPGPQGPLGILLRGRDHVPAHT